MKELKTVVHRWVDPSYENEVDETSFTIFSDGDVRVSFEYSCEELYIHIDELADIVAELKKEVK